MIRRDQTTDSHPSPRWVLISQIDHAHLAGQLAEPWTADCYAPLWPRRELLWAIHHHDDGWHGWEQRPEVDPQSGRPRGFTEMPPLEALAIWTRSIDAAARAGALEAYVVAGHFCALARRAAHWRTDAAPRQATEAFVALNESSMAAWLATWQAANPAEHTPQRAETAVKYLQFFDALSLWFCCATATAPQTFEAPGGRPLSLTPLDAEHISLVPWPFGKSSLDVEITGRSVLVEHYNSADELAAAPAQPLRLRWTLEPEAKDHTPGI
jgi:hypothetical protein